MSDCDVCEDFRLLEKATCDEKAYRWSVVKTLCYITTLLTTEESVLSPTTIILDQVVKTFTEVESDYSVFTSVGLIDSTRKINAIRVVNSLNIPLDFSYDGGAKVAFTVLPATVYEESLNIVLNNSTSLQMRKTSGTASSGSVYVEGRYLLNG